MNKKALTGVLALIVAMALTSFAYAAPSISMTGSKWTVYNYPVIMPPNAYTNVGHATTIPTGGVSFNFPDADDGYYTALLLDNYNVPLSSVQTITATIQVVGDGILLGNPGSSGNSPTPAYVRLYFATTNNAGSGNGAFAYTDFWWSNPASFTFGSSTGTITITSQLQGALWSDWNGQFGTGAQATAFATALKNVKYVGLSFGSGWFFANGVGASAGSATFQLLDFTIS